MNSKSEKHKFMHNGYSYIFDQKCCARTKKFWHQSHGSDLAKITVDIIRANIREQGLQTTEIPSVLFNHVTQGITMASHGYSKIKLLSTSNPSRPESLLLHVKSGKILTFRFWGWRQKSYFKFWERILSQLGELNANPLH
ncbi:hypothetical protein MXB_1804 [Myxobolus squamalis]|nr:hypothetical protein MXB_1804 [Myxobolus squamalis]